MAKKTLNAENLSKLGADRLAGLLIDLSTGHADLQRRLRLELAYALGAQELGRDLRKRMVSLRRAKAKISWRKRKAFVKELQGLHDMITRVGDQDPTLGFDLLWEFLELTTPTLLRSHDKTGEIAEVFDAARPGLAPLAERALLDPRLLADRVWQAVSGDDRDVFDGLIPLLAPALGQPGFAKLKQHLASFESQPVTEPQGMDHEALAFLRALRSETGNYRQDQKTRLIRQLRQDIAAAEGDVDALMSELSPAALRHPDTGAELASRFLAQNRAAEALQALDTARPDADEDSANWDAAYITCLTALGRGAEVQAFRWQCFETRLDAAMLRAHLAELPDFDDVEAEDAARQYAKTFDNLTRAMGFLLDWPDLPSLADVILARQGELRRAPLPLLTRVVDQLRTRFPLSAMLALRAAMLHPAVTQEQLSEFLSDCAHLDSEIPDYGTQPDHAAFLAQLQGARG